MKNLQNKKQAGFTVVEVLVTSLIFSIMAITVSAIFIQIINIERRGLSIQKIQDNALLVLEEMSRDIRVSRISNNQDSLDCSASTITMIHPIKGTIIYRTTSGIVQRSVNSGSYVDVSASNVNFIRMNFCISGSSINDNQSPRVSIITSIQNRTGREIVKINLQTTTTSRNLFDELQYP